MRNLKSVYREMGWGNSKEFLNKKRDKAEQRQSYTSRISCPICGETKSENLMELRAEFWECRTCGFADDVGMWDKKEDIKWLCTK